MIKRDTIWGSYIVVKITTFSLFLGKNFGFLGDGFFAFFGSLGISDDGDDDRGLCVMSEWKRKRRKVKRKESSE